MHHRRARLSCLPLARPLGARRNHYAADRNSRIIHSDVLLEPDEQHHVAWRNRDRDRRDDRCGHHHGRERAQIT